VDYSKYSFQPPLPGPEKKTIGGSSLDYFHRSVDFMVRDLARSGLVPEDMECYADKMPEGAKEEISKILSSYVIPFYDLNGAPIVEKMYRRRRQPRPGHEVARYKQPVVEAAEGYGRYPYIPRGIWNLTTSSPIVHICEGEKKTAAVMKFGGVRAIGTTGKDCADETVAVISMALERLGATEVWIWPDADIGRYDVRKSYSSLINRLRALLPEVKFSLRTPGWDGKAYKGVDDALAGGISWSTICDSSSEYAGDIVYGAKELALQYGLQTIETKNSVKLRVNEYNFGQILRSKELWGDWWTDIDKRKLMLDDSEVSYEKSAQDICSDFQSRLSMPEVPLDRLWNSVVHRCVANERSPWREYLEGLEWDGEKRLEGWMEKYLGVECDDPQYVRDLSVKFLCAVVARTMKPGCPVDWMMILHGAQGVGKSSLPAFLLGDQWADLARFSSGGKDRELLMSIARSRIVNFDEMSVFFTRQEETEHIKELVTRTVDTFRAPYAREDKDVRRGCVLYGSTNKPQLIKHDDSGYRRWCILSVTGTVETEFGVQFDWDGLGAVREQLWAEATRMVRERGVGWVSQVSGASRQAAKRTLDNPIEDALLHALAGLLQDTKKLNGGELPRGADGKWYVRNGPLTELLGEKNIFQRHSGNINQFWTKWGCTKGEGNYGRVRRISEELENYLTMVAG
jgi:hypothetical protein